MKIKKGFKKVVSMVLVLTMIFSLAPNSLFVRNVQAATMSAGDDLVLSDPTLATSSNWETSNFKVASSGAIASGDTGCMSAIYGTSGTSGYVYWNTETTFPAGTYSIVLTACGTSATLYPYLNGQVSDVSQTVTSSWGGTGESVTLTFTVGSETTGYMGVYAVATSTTSWVNFTNISITCVSVSSSGGGDESGASVNTDGAVYIDTDDLDIESTTTETAEIEWGSGNVPGTFESGTLGTSVPSSNGFYCSSTSYSALSGTYANGGSYSLRMNLRSSSSTLYYGASSSSSTTYSSLSSKTLSSSASFSETTYTFEATATTMYIHFGTQRASGQYAYSRAVLTDLTVGTTYTVSFYSTGYTGTSTRYVYIDDVVVSYTATRTVTLSGTYDIYRDDISDTTISVGDSVPTFPASVNVYLYNVDDSADSVTDTAEVTWDTTAVDTSTIGAYKVTGTFTYNNKTYTITAYVYVLQKATIISGADGDEGCFENVTDDAYSLNDWILGSTYTTWSGAWNTESNEYYGSVDSTGEADSGTYALHWYWETVGDEKFYALYDSYETYLAPGTYTLSFYAVGTGANVGAYFDGTFYDGVAVADSSDWQKYTVEFEVEEPILQTLAGLYVEGTSDGTWGYIDGVSLEGYQFDETDTEQIASFEEMFLVSNGYNYVDLTKDSDENVSTELSSAYKYSFTAGNTETSNTDDLLSTGGFFEDSDKTYLEWNLGSGWWTEVLTTNDYTEKEPADWESGQVTTWISDTLSSTDTLTYTVPILPAGTYTLYYSVMGLDGMVYPYINGTAEGAGHGLVSWDRYQYYSYTFTVDSLQFDYPVGVYYSLDATGYAYTDNVYLLSSEEITEDMITLYEEYKANKVATSVTYDSGTISGYNYQAVADAGTYDLNQYFTGTSSDDGKVLTDKSVTLASMDFEGDGDVDVSEPGDTTFNVALSALSQSYESQYSQIKVIGGSETGTAGAVDIVFVFDISMSMIYQDGYLYDEKLVPMIDALNDAIDVVISENPDNRVAVVGYTSDSDTIVMLNLTSDPQEVTSTTLSGTTYTYENTGSEHTYIGYTINTASQARDVTATIGGADGSCLMDTFGTYMQKGISYAGYLLESAGLTDSGYVRTPNIFILTDGEADYYNTDYTASPISGTTNSSASYTATTGYYTLLTANYWKDKIAAHYTEINGVDTEAYFYTCGYDLDESDYYEYVMGLMDPSTLSSATGSIATSLYSQIQSSEYADNYDYVTEYYEALDSAQLETIISEFASMATSASANKVIVTEGQTAINSADSDNISGYTGLSAYLEFTDYIGSQMQVEGVPYVSYQGVMYYPSVAPGDTSRPITSVTNEDGSITTTYKYYGYVNPYSTEDAVTEDDELNLSGLIVQITTYENGEQKVYFAVPNSLLPACTYDDTGFTESYPIRLVYQVGLVMDKNIAADTSYYTNKWDDDEAYTTAAFIPSIDNPYYYTTEDWTVDGTYITDSAIDYDDMTETEYTGLIYKIVNGVNYIPSSAKKVSNATRTFMYSMYGNSIQEGTTSVTGYMGLDEYTSDDVYYMTVTYQLGNNGKVTLSNIQKTEYYVWLGHEAEITISDDLEDPDKFNSEATLENADETEDSYEYTLSEEDDALVLRYTNNTDVGDYTYNLVSSGGETTEVIIHVYNVSNDLYVLDYGLGVDVSDTTYGNGFLQNDILEIDGAETIANYTGIAVVENDDYMQGSYGVYAEGVQGVLESDDAVNEIDTANENAIDGEVIYTPTKFMSDIDEFYYCTQIKDASSTALTEYRTGVTMYAKMQVMPAANVYYEDNFASSGADNTDPAAGFVISGSVENRADSTGSDSTLQSNSLETQYGYDSAYSDDIYFSNASATQLETETDSLDTSAVFQFKGTGFTLYARCNSATATMAAMVYDTDGNYVTNAVVNTFYQNGILYQVPALNVTDLEYGEYKVVIYVAATSANQYSVYLDGLRIYNPAGVGDTADTTITGNYITSEVGAQFDEIRNLILGKGYTTKAVTTTDADGNEVTENELVAGSGIAGTFMTFDTAENKVNTGSGTFVEEYYGIDQGETGSSYTTDDYYSYLTSGPNNETYLSTNEGVALTLEAFDDTDDGYTFQVSAKGVRRATELSAYVLDYDTDGSLVVQTSETYAIGTSSGMYYRISMPESASDRCVVLLMNTGENVLSLKDVKSNGYSYLTSDNTVFGEDMDYLGEVTNTICDYLAKAGLLTVADDTSSDYGDEDTDDAAGTEELENTVKAQVSSVENEVFSLRFIGTVDSLKYNNVGFMITVYDESGNIIKAENAKTVTTVYSSIIAGGQTVTAPEGSYFYAYTYRNISASDTYYFRVANYTSYESDISVSGYKYYKVSNGTLSVVDSIGGGSDE